MCKTPVEVQCIPQPGVSIIRAAPHDLDTFFRPQVSAYAAILPGPLIEDDVLSTYPFRVQSVTGGIPVPPRPCLVGDVSTPRRLGGSITNRTKVLTGSVSNRRVLKGSISGARYNNKIKTRPSR
jgi:hypothetical protein